jgi:hypothetical protein
VAGQKAIAAQLAAFVAANQKKGGFPCPSCLLPTDLRTALVEQHEAGAYASTLARFLRANGHKVSDYSLAKHFREHEQSAR